MIDETKETYKWVTEAFLECMHGVTPKTVVTDGDLSIRAAVAELMPEAVHRLCSWHIGKNAISNVKDPGFLPRLNKLIFRYYSSEEFEVEWTKLMNDFGLHNSAWARSLYERKETWAEAYVRGHFFSGMRTTQRSEGMHSLIKLKVSSKMRLWEFVRAIDLSLSWLRHCESKDDFDTLNSSPMLGRTNMIEIERQAAAVYTRAMFFKVRDQIMKEGKYIVTQCRRFCDKITYNLIKYNAQQSSRKVIYDETLDAYECECCYFPTLGIPCRHIFAVMKHNHVTHIPESLIVLQWTMQAKDNLGTTVVSTPTCRYTCSEERARYLQLSTRAADISFLGSKTASVFKIANEGLSRLYTVLQSNWSNIRDNVKECSETYRTNFCVRNPLFTKAKGYSKFKGSSKRLKTCTVCHKPGHNKTTCARRRHHTSEPPPSPRTRLSSDNGTDGDINLSIDDETSTPMGRRRDTCMILEGRMEPYGTRSANSSYNDGRKEGNYFGSINFSDNENTSGLKDRLTDVDTDSTDWWGSPYGTCRSNK